MSLATSLRSRLEYGFVPGVSKSVRCGLWWQWIAALALGLAASLDPTRVHALDLEWSAPVECSTSAAQKARIEQLLAGEGLLAMALVVHGTVTRDHKRYRLSLRIASPTHEAVRVVPLADCASVDQAVVALIAMALDPAQASRPSTEPQPAPKRATAQGRRPAKRVEPAAAATAQAGLEPPTAGPVTSQEPPPGPDPLAPVEPVPPEVPASDRPGPTHEEAVRGEQTLVAPGAAGLHAAPTSSAPPVARAVTETQIKAEPRSSPRGLASAQRWGRAAVSVGVWSGGLPAPQLDTGLRVGLARGALYGELRADWMLARSDEVSWDSESKVRIRSAALGVAGCAAAGVWGERVRVGPCLRLSVLRSAGSVTQITARHDDSAFWLASTLSALLGVRLWSLLELSLEAGAGLPLTARPQFSVAGRGDAKVATLVSLHAVLGLGLRWEQKRRASSQNVLAPPIGR